MKVTNTSGRGPPLTEEEALELEKAKAQMLARHKLIEGMIRNNELQLKNESARGGAEIERECALREASRPDAGPGELAELERVVVRLDKLEDEHRRLVAEREWLNESLFEFDGEFSKDSRKRHGNA
jgi:hypothetical protein